MKVAHTVWTWMHEEFGRENPTDRAEANFEQALKEISFLEYNFVENFNFIVNIYKDKPEKFDNLLKKYDIELVNVYHFLTGEYEKDKVFAGKCCEFLSEHGGKYMNVQAPKPESRDNVTDYDLQTLSDVLDDMGRMAANYEVTLCLHPHWDSLCEKSYQLDYIDRHTRPDLVKYCFDTAHTIFGGMDPVEVIKKYGARAGYMHFKDTLADRTASVDYPTRFARPLGEGIVDFPGVFNALKSHGYDGIICVELDYQQICNFDSAQKSRQYLKSVLNL